MTTKNGRASSRTKVREEAFIAPGVGWQSLADVQTEAVDWLFPWRIPRNMLSLVEAKKNGGKSTMLSAIAAYQLGGPPLPGCKRERNPGQVLWLAGEESAAQAVRPRIDLAGGDPRGVILPDLDKDTGIRRRLYLPGDLHQLDALVRDNNLKLIVGDPYISFVASGACMRDEDSARAVLEPIAEWAAQRHVTVIYSRHLRKGSGGDPLDAGLGNTAVGAVARTICRLDPHPIINGLRTMCRVAAFAGVQPPTLTYRIVGDAQGLGRIEWEGESAITTDEVVDAVDDAAERSALDDAIMIVKGILSGGPKSAQDLVREANDAGVSVATLRRARTQLGCTTKRVVTGQHAYIEWTLPPLPVTVDKPKRRKPK